MCVKNDNWLDTERLERLLEAPTSPVESDNEQSSIEADLKRLDEKLRSVEVIDHMRACLGIKPYTTVKELEENLLSPNEIGQWYDKGYDRNKFIRAILNLKCWAFGSCWVPVDRSEMYLNDLFDILINRIPHSFSPEVKEAFLAHLDLILDWFYGGYNKRPTLEEEWRVIYKYSKYKEPEKVSVETVQPEVRLTVLNR